VISGKLLLFSAVNFKIDKQISFAAYSISQTNCSFCDLSSLKAFELRLTFSAFFNLFSTDYSSFLFQLFCLPNATFRQFWYNVDLNVKIKNLRF